MESKLVKWGGEVAGELNFLSLSIDLEQIISSRQRDQCSVPMGVNNSAYFLLVGLTEQCSVFLGFSRLSSSSDRKCSLDWPLQIRKTNAPLVKVALEPRWSLSLVQVLAFTRCQRVNLYRIGCTIPVQSSAKYTMWYGSSGNNCLRVW